MDVNNSYMFLRVKRIGNRLATISLRLRTQDSRNLHDGYENGRSIVHVDQDRTTSANIGTIGRPGQIEVLLVPLTRWKGSVERFDVEGSMERFDGEVRWKGSM